MSGDVELSETGVWFDTQTDQVVYAPPVEGVQIVPKGGELTPDVKANIERHSEAVVVVVATEPDPQPVKAAKKAAPVKD